MIRTIALFLLLTTSLQALPQSQLTEQASNQSRIETMRPTSTHTPTLTPTVTVGCGTSYYVYSGGNSNSYQDTYVCEVGASDSWRKSFEQVMTARGYPVTFVGPNLANGSALQCNNTSAANGELSNATASKILTQLPTYMPTAGTNQIIMIGPALKNDASTGVSEADMTQRLKDALTNAHSLNTLARLYIVTDLLYADGTSPTTSIAAWTAAQAWGVAQGWNVGALIDVYNCLTINELCDNDGHIHATRYGMQLQGTCAANQVIADKGL